MPDDPDFRTGLLGCLIGLGLLTFVIGGLLFVFGVVIR